ncbi:MAG TPA: hypothetical protein VK152_01310 [Paludibacter sp.]|nr:hypothetical protein [Paludibacter sp.]
MTKEISRYLAASAGVLTVTGAVLQLFDIFPAPFIFSVGALLFIFLQFNHVLDNKDADTRQQRLSRNGLFVTLLLGVAAYFMFTHSNLWVLAVLIYALSTFFLSFRGDYK